MSSQENRPGPRVGEDVFPRPLHLVPAVQAVPAGVHAAHGFVVVPDGSHGFRGRAPRGRGRGWKRQVGVGNRCRFASASPSYDIPRPWSTTPASARAWAKFPATRHSAVLAAQSPDLIERERGLLHSRRRVLEADLQVRAHPAPRGQRGGQGPDAGILRARPREGILRAATNSARKGRFRRVLAHVPRPLRGQREEGRRKGEALARRSGSSRSTSTSPRASSRGRRRPPTGRWEQYFHDEFVRSLFALSVETLREECALRGKDLPFLLFERYELDRDPEERLTYDRLAEEAPHPRHAGDQLPGLRPPGVPTRS